MREFLFGFQHKRRWLSAIGFYFAWLLISYVIIVLTQVIFWSIPHTDFTAYLLGRGIPLFLSTVLALLIGRAKGLWTHPLYILYLFGVGLAAWGFGPFGGLLLVAILTTRQPQLLKKKKRARRA